MKKTALYFFLLACCSSLNSFSQTLVADTVIRYPYPAKTNAYFKFTKFIPGDFTSMDIDVLDNIYLITAGNQLKKLNANGDSVSVFNDVKKYGNPGFIDVSNPLKILVYYPNYSTVVILDRLLTFRNSINFRKANIFSVKTLATSYDNNIWLFDEQDFKLKKIDDDGKPLQESTDWRLLMDAVPSPTQLIDRDNFVYLYDKNKGFYIFDYYGTYKNTLPFLQWEHIAISGNKLYGFKDGRLYSYELKTLSLKDYTIPSFFENYSDIKTMNGKVYLLKKEGIEVYSVL